jgi:hypothetical protein
MVFTAAQPDIGAAPARRSQAGVWHGRGRLSTLVAVLLILLLGGAAGLAIDQARQAADAPTTGAATAAIAPVQVPDRAVDGKIAFAIPLGAADAQLDGGTPYVMPPVIRLHTGDAVIVTNEDVYPHIILRSLVMPGTSATIVFDEPGVNAFSSGCTANGGTINSFTSVIVSERS